MPNRYLAQGGDEAARERALTTFESLACALNGLAFVLGLAWLLLTNPGPLVGGGAAAATLAAAAFAGLWFLDHLDELAAVHDGTAMAASTDEILGDLAMSLVRRFAGLALGAVTYLVAVAGAVMAFAAVALVVEGLVPSGAAASQGRAVHSLVGAGACALACLGEVAVFVPLEQLRRAVEQRLATPPFRVAQEPAIRILDEEDAPAARALAPPGEHDVLVILDEPAGPLCQVCGTAIEGTHMRCERCQTPHHVDCWEYAGACSTYGCRCRDAARRVA